MTDRQRLLAVTFASDLEQFQRGFKIFNADPVEEFLGRIDLIGYFQKLNGISKY